MALILRVISLISILMMPSLKLQAQGDKLRMLHVSATGTINIPATIAELSVGIEIHGPEATVVQKKLKKDNNSLLDFLSRKKVQRLKTASYRIQPQYSYQNGKRKSEGFTGNTVISFQVSVGDVGLILDDVLQEGANELKKIRFTATEDELEKAQQMALEMASQEALAKGKHVLQGLHLKYGGIAEITVGQREMRPPEPMSRLAFDSSGASGVNIEAGDVTVEAQISLTLSYQ